MLNAGNQEKMTENTKDSLEDSSTALEKRLNFGKNQENIPKKTIAAITAAITSYMSMQESLIYPEPKLSPWIQKARQSVLDTKQNFYRTRTINNNYKEYPLLLRYGY